MKKKIYGFYQVGYEITNFINSGQKAEKIEVISIDKNSDEWLLIITL